jgi:signal transduction histidine kinase
MTLRTKLTIAFTLFAALPALGMLWPVSHALSRALEAEYDARLGQAARAVEGEYGRLTAEVVAATRDLAHSPELEALARDRSEPGFEAAEVSGRAAPWMRARGLDVLAVASADGVVLSSGHLPGRAGDADPELRALFAATGPGRAVPRVITRAGPEGVEPVLASIAWEEVPGASPPLRVISGLALDAQFAARLAALTGGDVEVLAPERTQPLAQSYRRGRAGELAGRLIEATRARTREIPLVAGGQGGPGAPNGTIAVTLPVAGLAWAQATVTLTLLVALVIAVAAAWLVGGWVARRITRPVEALRAGALRVAGGELDARVEAQAAGEVADLVTAFNRMTSDLAATTARAAAAERVAAWREVARRLAHEVKNPLTPVAMSVDTLRDAWARQRPDFGEIFDEGTRAISEEVRRLVRIVDEFGRFARLPAPERRPVSGGELLSATLALYPEASGDLRVLRDVPPELPVVEADPDQIQQVLHNLIRNGIEAVGGRGTIRIAAERPAGGGMSVTVSDDGPGIRPEDLARIFEPYFTTKAAGTGLGLAIAERIVKEHGGRLEARSEPGHGATFTLWLPEETGI